MNTADPVVRDFIRRLCQRSQQVPDMERREHQRFHTVIPVEVQPCDQNGEPCGEFTRAVTRDFSVSGLSFLQTRPIEVPFVVIRIVRGTESLTLKARVVRSQTIGVFYETGVCFMERMTADGALSLAAASPS